MSSGIKSRSYKPVTGHFLGHDKEPQHKIATKKQSGKSAVVHSHSATPKRHIKSGGHKRGSKGMGGV
jgi:hypothetical protein